MRLKITGPIENGSPTPMYYNAQTQNLDGGSMWADVWYNNTVDYFEIIGVEITYMDNRVVMLTEDDVEKIRNQ